MSLSKGFDFFQRVAAHWICQVLFCILKPAVEGRCLFGKSQEEVLYLEVEGQGVTVGIIWVRQFLGLRLSAPISESSPLLCLVTSGTSCACPGRVNKFKAPHASVSTGSRLMFSSSELRALLPHRHGRGKWALSSLPLIQLNITTLTFRK